MLVEGGAGVRPGIHVLMDVDLRGNPPLVAQSRHSHQGGRQVAVQELGHPGGREGPGLPTSDQAPMGGARGVDHLIRQRSGHVKVPTGPVIREGGHSGPRIAQQSQPGHVTAESVLRDEPEVGHSHRPVVVAQEQGVGRRIVREPQRAQGHGVRRRGLAGQAERGQDAAGRGLSRIAVGGDLDLQHALQAPGGADSSRQALAVAIAQQPVEAGLEGPIAIGEGVDHRQAAGAERLRTA